MVKAFLRWIPSLIIMSLLFYFSNLQGTSLSPTYLGNYLANKAAHMFWYAILCASFWFATKNVFVAVLLTTLYGASDEIHQMFVPTRTGRINDVVIDFSAAGFMGLFLYYFERFLESKAGKKLVKGKRWNQYRNQLGKHKNLQK